jgi:EAL domain-containing protein (putative c-di-GMP-specific phosphodiesterase class I)/GGDEF domain-containing protein
MTEAEPPPMDDRYHALLLELKSALFDQNTGLYAYPFHFDELQRMVEWRPTVGVVFLEVFDFDRIEWLCGWQVFDGILERIAREMRTLRGRIFPASGLLTLSGVHGGGFILFLPECGAGEAPTLPALEVVAAKVEARVRAAVCDRIPEELFPEVEISTGYSLLRCEPVFRIERLIYRSIEEARAMAARSAHRDEQRSGAELRQIIRAGLVETHFQPIVRVDSGQVFGYEALARGPRGSMFETPKVMFGYSDRMRITPLLDSVCRRRALSAARTMEPGKKLFINSLPSALLDPRFTDAAAEGALPGAHLPPGRVVLELTERSGIEDFEQFRRRLETLRERGFQVAIDDVGTGYSSLQTISEVRPEFLKIDHSLVQGVHRSLIKQEIVSSILQIGDRIGSQVIAEGIESEEEFEKVKGFGVRLGQGFLLGAPEPDFGRSAAPSPREH